MAIGIRRDRGGVMPGTVSHPSAVATAVVKGDLVKLSSGLLVNCDDGDALSEDQIFLALTNYVANVTHVAATNVDLLVMPITDLLTFIGPVTGGAGEAVEALVAGSTLGINATGDGFTDSSAASADFVIDKVLEYTSATAPDGTATVEGHFLLDDITS